MTGNSGEPVLTLDKSNIFHENLEYDKERGYYYSFIRHTGKNSDYQWINLDQIKGTIYDVKIEMHKNKTVSWFILLELNENSKNIIRTIEMIEKSVNENILEHDLTIFGLITEDKRERIRKTFANTIVKDNGKNLLKINIASVADKNICELQSNFFSDKKKMMITDITQNMNVVCNIVLNHVEFRDDNYELIWYLHGGIVL